jgi:hypothetical protein
MLPPAILVGTADEVGRRTRFSANLGLDNFYYIYLVNEKFRCSPACIRETTSKVTEFSDFSQMETGMQNCWFTLQFHLVLDEIWEERKTSCRLTFSEKENVSHVDPKMK